MRIISNSAAAQVGRQFGSEPLIVVGLSLGGNFIYYGDREHPNFTAKLLEVADLDNVINIAQNASVSSVTVVLIDVDGELKQLFNENDLHKRPFRVYQYFPETDFVTDKILLFDGYVSSPVVYNEAAMTLQLTGVSKLEDIEVGFSPDNAVWRHLIPNEIEPQAWPMPFGTPIDFPAAQITKIPYGTLASGFGIADFSLTTYLAFLSQQVQKLQNWAGACYLFAAFSEMQVYLAEIDADALVRQILTLQEALSSLQQQSAEGVPGLQPLIDETNQQIQNAQTELSLVNQRGAQAAQLANAWMAQGRSATSEYIRLNDERANKEHIYAQQITHQHAVLYIWNGASFPRGQLLLKIGDALVFGHFTRTDVNPILDAGQVDAFQVTKYVHPATCCYKRQYCDILGCTQTNIDVPRIVDKNNNLEFKGDTVGFAWVGTGSPVQLVYSPVEYITSIIPCTLLKVSAYFTRSGQRILTTVPSEYYTTEWRDFGDGLRALVIRLSRALSTYKQNFGVYATRSGEYSEDDADYEPVTNRFGLVAPIKTKTVQGTIDTWEDQIYVTVRSDVGPNIVDTIEYLITHYLPGTLCDPITFAEARAAVEEYPANFVLLDRRNIIELLSAICRQACLGLWYSEGVAYLRYLPNIPNIVTPLTEDVINSESLSIEYTPTEDVITKLTATYKTTYTQEEPYTIVARYNQAKYGMIADVIDYFIYTSREPVVHSLTFWLIRRGNTWKRLRCTTSLSTLIFENMDAVLVDLKPGFVANGPVTGLIEETQYNSLDFSINYTIWLPVRAGEMETYKFAYYNIGELDEYFPEPVDWITGNGAGSPIIRDLDTGNTGHTIVNLPPREYEPRNTGQQQAYQLPIKSQPKLGSTSYAYTNGGQYPPVDSGYADAQPNMAEYDYSAGESRLEPLDTETADELEKIGATTVINLHLTKIVDGNTKQWCTLASLIRSIEPNTGVVQFQGDPVLNLRAQLPVNDPDTGGLGGFIVKHDPTNTYPRYAAELAYLKEELP